MGSNFKDIDAVTHTMGKTTLNQTINITPSNYAETFRNFSAKTASYMSGATAGMVFTDEERQAAEKEQ